MILQQALGPILRGMFTVTIPLAVISCVLGFILAIILVIMRYTNIAIFRWISKGTVFLMRGTPMLVILYLLFFGLAEFRIMLSSWGTAIIAFTLFVAAFLSEAIRGTLQAVDTGQWEAGFSLGLPKYKVFRLIIIPQAIPATIPTFIGYFISAIKMTSLVSNIALSDMLLAGKQFIDYYYAPFLIYFLLSILYLLMYSVLAWIQRRVTNYFLKAQVDPLEQFLMN